MYGKFKMERADITKEKVEELYKKKILEQQERFLSSLQDAPQVASALLTQGVITKNDELAIVRTKYFKIQKNI